MLYIRYHRNSKRNQRKNNKNNKYAVKVNNHIVCGKKINN